MLDDHANCVWSDRNLELPTSESAKFGSRHATRTARFELKGRLAVEKFGSRNEGPIRIPLGSSPFLFNDFVFPSVPSKCLKLRSVLFSIPTAPTNIRLSLQIETNHLLMPERLARPLHGLPRCKRVTS